MEVRPGYRQSEVGVIPQDWETVPFSEFMEFQNGVNADKSAYGTGFRFINVLEVITKSHLRAQDIPGRVELSKSSAAAYAVRRGDIVFNRTSETQEEVGLAAVYVGDESIVFGGFVIRGRPKDERIHTIYAGYGLRAPLIRVQIVARGQGAIRANIGQADLKKVWMALPTKPEQEAIAETLSDADGLIESLEQLLVKKRQFKQGTMQALLTGKKRLPEFSGDWVSKPIGSEIDLQTGFPFPSRSYSSGGVRLLRGSNIKRGVTDWGNDITKFWPSVSSDYAQFELREGDIVVAMDGSLVGRSFARLSETDLPALLLQRVARIRSATIDMGYLKEQICSEYFTDHCDAVKTVTAIPHISPKDIRDFVVPIPPSKDEQSAIAEILSDMGAEIASLQTKLAKVRGLKQGMMQELLTGRTRLA